jgi:hypothetical protein
VRTWRHLVLSSFLALSADKCSCLLIACKQNVSCVASRYDRPTPAFAQPRKRKLLTDKTDVPLTPEDVATFRIMVAFGRVLKISKKRLLVPSYLSLRPSVRPSTWTNSTPTGRIFMKLGIRIFFENLSRILGFTEI